MVNNLDAFTQLAKERKAVEKIKKGMVTSKREREYFKQHMERWLGLEIVNKIKGLYKND